ncbi:MAG: MFS transporter [Bacteroidota bacterium]
MKRDRQYVKFCAYGFLKNLRFFDAFLLLFFLENKIDYSQIGILYAVREIVINGAEVPSGIFADAYGRKRSLLFAFLIYITSFSVFYISKDFSLLLMAMVLMGVADAFRSGTHKGMIMDYLKHKGWQGEKVKYYGETRSWSQKGSALSALMAGIMVFYSGNYRLIYLLSIIPYLINFVNIYTYHEELNHSIKKKEKAQFSIKKLFQSILLSLRKGRVIQLVNSSALHTAYLKSIKDYIQPLIVNLSFMIPIAWTLDSKGKSGLIIGMVYFLIFLLTSAASKHSSKILSMNVINIEQKSLFLGLSMGLLSGICYLLNIWWVALVLFVMIYIIENGRKPILTGFLVENVPNEILTSVLSAQSFYSTLMSAMIAICLGTLAENYGVGISLFIVSVILMVLTLVIGVRRVEIEEI